MLAHTAGIFQRHPEVSSIVIVIPESESAVTHELVRHFELVKVTAIVAGGVDRQESVRNGLAALPEGTDIVLTHDAVRPFITRSDISMLIGEIRQSGAATLSIPVGDTLVRSKLGRAGETVAREGLHRMLTPQGFRYDVLVEAHDLAAASGRSYTDEVTLVRASGREVTLVTGSTANIKITTAADWELAQWMWPAFAEWREQG